MGKITKRDLTDEFKSQIDNKLSEYVNAKDIGLVGDGVTNDATNLNLWITSIGSNKVDLYLSNGIYKLASNVTIPNNVNLVFANGGVLKRTNSAVITLNCSIDAGLWQILDDDGTGSWLGSPNISEVYPEWFGINNMSNSLEYASNMAKLSAATLTISPGFYNLDRTFNLPENVLVEFCNVRFIPQFTTGVVINASYAYPTDTQPTFHTKGKLRIQAPNTSNTLVGICLGASKNSSFDEMTVVNTVGGGIKVQSIDGDVDNFNFKNAHLFNTGGIIISTNDAVVSGANITDGSFRDSIVACDIVGISPLNFYKHSSKALFGIRFERLLINAKTTSLISSVCQGGYIDKLTFVDVMCEIHSPSISHNYMTLNGFSNCKFDITGQFTQTNGIVMVGCTDNKFERTNWNGYAGLNDKILNMDQDCFNNTFDGFKIGITEIIHDASKSFYAASSQRLFTNNIIDAGLNNKITNGRYIDNLVTLVNSKTKFSAVSDGVLANYTCRNVDVVYDATEKCNKFTFKAGTPSSPIITFPFQAKSSYTGVRLKYKPINDNYTVSGGNYFGIMCYNFQMYKILSKTVGSWIELTFIIPTGTGNSYIGVDGGSTNIDIQVYIKDFEFIEGQKIPYLPNYHYIDGSQ